MSELSKIDDKVLVIRSECHGSDSALPLGPSPERPKICYLKKVEKIREKKEVQVCLGNADGNVPQGQRHVLILRPITKSSHHWYPHILTT